MRKTRVGRIAWFLLPFAAVACASIGPKTISRDRVDYIQALRDSWKSQILLNMVALRYGEAPVFLEVASVISQYSLVGQASVGAGWTSGVTKGNSQSVGLTGQYADKPTITYMPLTGEQFTRSMLTPIQPSSIIGMVQAGWPVDFVFRLAVRSMNGLNSQAGARLMGSQPSPDYYRVLAALRRIQQSGVIGMRVEKRDKQDVAILFLSAKGADVVADDIHLVREKLGLAESAGEVTITFGAVPADNRTIAMLTRSMTEVMIELASWMDVPAAHLAEGRVAPGQQEVTLEDVQVKPLIKIKSAPEEPKDAFAKVYFHDNWFFIEDRDFPSKRIFSFLTILLSLAETGGGQAAPVVTVQAGGG